MIYTPMTLRAMEIAYDAHRGQVDKCGAPYILHPAHVAEAMTDEIRCAAALLHDVVEDTDVTLDDLRREFPPEVTDAVALLTHQPGEDYLAYVARVAENPVAADVKRADLKHNSDPRRLACADISEEKRRRLIDKYAAALKLLSEIQDGISKNQTYVR